MKVLGHILFWIVAVGLVALMLGSLGYRAEHAILISMVFCPCCIALEFLMPKTKTPFDKLWLSLAVLVAATALIIMTHVALDLWRASYDPQVQRRLEAQSLIVNPIFLGILFTALSLGDYFWVKWLDKRFKAASHPITFFSDRKSVTVNQEDIAYIESNDTEVRLFLRDGSSYRNKTGITQWENLLGDGFLRIHRSYLVNRSLASIDSPDSVSVGGVSLPVSRKYKERVQESLGE